MATDSETLADDAAQLMAAGHGRTPAQEAWPIDSREYQLLKRVPKDGTAVGNTTLMRELGWPEIEYREVRNHLLDRGQIELGRGRGGSVRRVIRSPASKTVVAQDASPPSRTIAPSTSTGPSNEKATMLDESAPNDNDDAVVEGLDDAEPAGLGEYPIDSLMIRNETRTVHEVLRRIEKEQFILDPDFQRAFVWNEERQSRLIESVVLRIPLPVMYLAENQDGKLVVVDGLQRLTTFQRYASNQFALQLDNAVLAGRRFVDLDMRLQNRIEDTQLILYVIDAKVPERVRLDIFERVNSGVALTRQQMRNCLYNGLGTHWLRDRVGMPAFQELFSPKNFIDLQKSMRDREFVNRFAAFQLFGWENYRGEMDAFLGDALKKLNAMNATELAALTLQFEWGIENNVSLFGNVAFRRHERGQTRRAIFNVALFDVFSTGLGLYEPARVLAHAEQLRNVFYSLLEDAGFVASIAYGTNQRDRVQVRFTRVRAELKGVLGDP